MNNFENISVINMFKICYSYIAPVTSCLVNWISQSEPYIYHANKPCTKFSVTHM